MSHPQGQRAFRTSAWWYCPLIIFAMPSIALAHPGGGGAGGILQGFAHPLSGLDHFCAMFAVGLWAAQRRERHVWIIPAAFCVVMVLGAMLGQYGAPLPFAESGVLASVLILGIFVAAAVRLPLALSAAIVGLFALCHGHLHGTEMPLLASPAAWMVGFVAATLLLQFVGYGAGMLARRLNSAPAIRLAGGAVAACGLYLCLT